MTFYALIRLAILTFKQPVQAMGVLRGFEMTFGQRWMTLALAVSLSALLAGGLALTAPPAPPDDVIFAMVGQPLKMAFMQFLAMGFFAAMIAWVGQRFCGEGRFEDALLVVAWIELILVMLQAGIIVISLLLPPVAGILVVLTYGFAFFLILKMIQVLHGFDSVLLVLMGFLGTFFAVAVVLSILGSMFGFLPEIPTRDL